MLVTGLTESENGADAQPWVAWEAAKAPQEQATNPMMLAMEVTPMMLAMACHGNVSHDLTNPKHVVLSTNKITNPGRILSRNRMSK